MTYLPPSPSPSSVPSQLASTAPAACRTSAHARRGPTRAARGAVAAALLLCLLLAANATAAIHAAPLQQGGLAKLTRVALQLRQQMPWLLGMDAPRHYLLLVQNNHELRATGGFISAVGLLTVERGKVTDLAFADSYEFYRDGGQYPLAPAPMAEHMGIQLMLLRDANWWADLPTSAAMARTLYGDHTGVYPDGMVTVDLAAVKHLVGALGALEAPGSDIIITADNIEAEMIRFWEQPLDDGDGPPPDYAGNWAEWFAARKEFIPRIAAAALEQVQSGDVELPVLAAALHSALEDRSIQVWFDDAAIAAVLAEAGWDGALQPAPGADFLAVVDTNMGYNKVDAVLERSADYQVAWGANLRQGAQATLTLTYTHPGPVGDPDCDQSPRYGETYDDMIARCYFDYVRVYAPAGSRLLDVTGVASETVASRKDASGLQEFSAYFVMPTDSTNTVTFTYRLPAALQAQDYQLVVQRQAGTRPLALRVDVAGQTEELQIAGGQAVWEP